MASENLGTLRYFIHPKYWRYGGLDTGDTYFVIEESVLTFRRQSAILPPFEYIIIYLVAFLTSKLYIKCFLVFS